MIIIVVKTSANINNDKNCEQKNDLDYSFTHVLYTGDLKMIHNMKLY